MNKNKNSLRVIGIGNALVDVLAPITDDAVLEEMGLLRGGMQLVDEEHFHRLNNKLQAMSPHLASGGSAHNTILALANLGAQPAFIGKIGNDAYGRFLEKDCLDSGIRSFLTTDAQLPTGVASTFISPDGQRTFGTFLGAAASVHAADIKPEQLDGYDLLHIEGYLTQDHDMIDRVAGEARRKGLRVGLDLASYNFVENDRDFFEHLLHSYVNLVFANEEESYAFTHESDAQKAVSMLADICGEAVVKVGARGAYASRDGHTAFAPACSSTKVVDTTAAGDFFAAGYLWGLSLGCNVETCVRLGNLLGGTVIQVYGTAVTPQTWARVRTQAAALVK